MHPVIAEILNWKVGAPVKPVDQKRWQDALREVDADLTQRECVDVDVQATADARRQHTTIPPPTAAPAGTVKKAKGE